MLGPPTKQFKSLAPINPDALVPPDNFYRRLEEKLDLSFVRVLVRDCYGELGRPSIDPVVFFKLQLIGLFPGDAPSAAANAAAPPPPAPLLVPRVRPGGAPARPQQPPQDPKPIRG